MHVGRYGGHHGVNRTTRRIARLCWWPKLKSCVQAYIECCLPCARARPVHPNSFRGLLEKPGLFQMVSLDCIGPRTWHEAKQLDRYHDRPPFPLCGR